MRGKVGLLHGHIIAIGITPAHAGKRRSIGRLSQPTRDHPRVCGEKCSSVRSASHRRGSPPRVRGKVCDLTIIRVHHGITPAYAGKRLKRSHSIGHFSCILCLFHSVLHRASVSGGSRAGPRAPPCLPAQNTVVSSLKLATPITFRRAGGAGSWSWSELRWLLTRFPVKVIDAV